MREILFRGKNALGRWFEGGYYENNTGKYIISPALVANLIIPETVGQYTGLTDKNGRRIFEGDILKGYLDDEFPENYTIASVVWFGFGWFTKERNCCPDPLEKNDGEIYEVIGNIYDDKEILDVK